MKKLQLLVFMLLATASLMAQRAVTGTITDADGEALIGANIVVKGQSAIGTVTDIEGNYSLNVPDGYDALVVSYTGYATQDVKLTADNVVNIVLKTGVVLDEMVITALGISREEKSLGYAVQEISGDELASARETNVINSLQGKVAGVQIQGSPSSLGGSSRITIRGSNSFLGGNQPLFVVDGVPISNDNFATDSQQRGFGGESDPYDYGNLAQDINPDDVASMTVLKGASATALYGSRGANGVIIITTKTGKNRKGFGVDVNSSISWDKVTNLIPHQQQYGGGSIADTESGFNEVIIDGATVLYPAYGKDGSWGPKYGAQNVRHWDSWDPQASNFGETRPWSAPASGYEDFFETGVTYQNSVALSGGNDKGSFRLGYSNLNQEGTFPNSELSKNTFSFNSQYKVHERITVGLIGNYVRTEAENRNITGYNNGNPMQAFTQWWQTQLDLDRLKNSTWVDGRQATWNTNGVVKDADNNFINYDSDPNFFDNPHWVRENYLQEDNRDRFYGAANISIKLMEGLTLSSRLGTDFYAFSSREGIPNASVETSGYGEVARRFNENNFETKLMYTKNFGDISFTGGIGSNIMKRTRSTTISNTEGGIALEGFYNLGNSAAAASVSGESFNRQINSGFALASLGFKNWLYLDLTARHDASSTIDPDNNSYQYYSTSLSAVITDLPGMQDLGPISFAKVRASWAQAGNDAGEYLIYNTFGPQTLQTGNPTFSVPNNLNNRTLSNELTTEYEFGLDLRFFNNRLGIDAAYYDRRTKDQIFNAPVAPSSGFTSKSINAGEMRNYGFEVMVTATPIKTKDFTWNLGLNITGINNEVIELNDDVESINLGGTWAADLRVAAGETYMAIYGQDYIRENFERDEDGVITKNEGRIVVDEDGNYTFTDERVALGSAVADYIGGFNTSVSYKGLSLSALFDFQEGGKIHSTSLQWSKYSGMHPETVSYNGQDNIREDGMILDGVKADGSVNDIAVDPQTYYQTFWRRAAPNVHDASFVKLREVRLDYSLPNSMLSGTTFRDVKIGIYGRNLAILSSDLPYLDPQGITGAGNVQGLENAQIPSTKSWGVNLSFKL
ncbi:MAG: TonB-linked SusC/RagA family outer membrane protein [Saprospiraceae bacterium]|jgi:TonB-linked SusC/RagA family outer membrane protein